MSDSFDNLFGEIEKKTEEKPGWSPVVESELECEQCYQTVTEGSYNKQAKVLKFVCDNNHKNLIEGISLDV